MQNNETFGDAWQKFVKVFLEETGIEERIIKALGLVVRLEEFFDPEANIRVGGNKWKLKELQKYLNQEED